MTKTRGALRRGLSGVLTATALAGAAAVVLPASIAVAAPDPCAANEVTKTVGSVAQKTSDYLDHHPETNQAMTSVMQAQSSPGSVSALNTYFDTNPGAKNDIENLTAPLTDLAAKCKLPITLPQMLGIMQAVQGQGGLPGGTGSPAVIGVPGPGAVAVPRPGPAPATVAPGSVR